MKQEFLATASISENGWRLAIAPLILGAVVCVLAVGGSDASAKSNNLLSAEHETTSVIIVVPGSIATEANTAFSRPTYGYIRCNSDGFRRRTCHTWGRNPVVLWRRHSRSACNRRRDWNTRFNGAYVWVDNGCQATFRVRRR